MSEIDIDKLRELHAATTQGDWISTPHCPLVKRGVSGGFVADCDVAGAELLRQSKNAAFIAAAHSIWPELLDELERLRAENEKLRDAMQELLDFSDALQGRRHARSMPARLNAGALLNSESASKNQKQD